MCLASALFVSRRFKDIYACSSSEAWYYYCCYLIQVSLPLCWLCWCAVLDGVVGCCVKKLYWIESMVVTLTYQVQPLFSVQVSSRSPIVICRGRCSRYFCRFVVILEHLPGHEIKSLMFCLSFFRSLLQQRSIINFLNSTTVELPFISPRRSVPSSTSRFPSSEHSHSLRMYSVGYKQNTTKTADSPRRYRLQIVSVRTIQQSLGTS